MVGVFLFEKTALRRADVDAEDLSMATERKAAESITLTLNQEEAEELVRLVDSALGETRVEVHRTHTPAFREKVQHTEALLRSVLGKLRPPRP
jgi:hypothetical protein